MLHGKPLREAILFKGKPPKLPRITKVTELETTVIMDDGDTRFGFSVMGGIEEGFPARVDDITAGSPADRADLEVGDEILEVNGHNLEHSSHAEVIQHIHKCIRSRSICLRVKRRSPADTSGIDPSNIQEAYVIAVEQQAKERLAKLSALEKVQPIDMTNMPTLERPGEINGTDVNGVRDTKQIYAQILKEQNRNKVNGIPVSGLENNNARVEPAITATKVETESEFDLSALGITASETSAIGDNYSLSSDSSGKRLGNLYVETDSEAEVEITKYIPEPGSQPVSEEIVVKTHRRSEESPPDLSVLDAVDREEENKKATMSVPDYDMDNFVPRELPVDCPPSFVAASGMKDPPPFFSPEVDGNIHYKATLPKDQDNRKIQKNKTEEWRVKPQTVPAANVVVTPNAVNRTKEDLRRQQELSQITSQPEDVRQQSVPPQTATTVGIEELFSSLNNLNSVLKGSQDAEDIRFLQNLFLNQDFQQAVQVHNKVTDVHTQEVPVVPVIHNTNYLVAEVKGILRDVNTRESEELKHIFRNVEFESLVMAHDTIAAEDGWVPAADEDFDDQLERASQYTEEDSVKIVRIDKTAEPLGATVRNEGDSIIIGRIVRGGAADKSGLLHEGDEVLEINGYDMKGKSVNEVCDLMATMTGTLTFLLVPSREVKQPVKETAIVHIRANFDYDPEDDVYIPCRELGLSFLKGDILHVINQDDANWWQAYREGEDDQTLAGLIPSKHFRQQREAMKHTLVDDKEPTKKRGWFCAKKRKKKKKVLYNANQSEEYDVDEILTYEEVALYQPRGNRLRPIVLIGPTNVGRQELRQRLIDTHADKFAKAVPHTTRSKKSGEVDGRDYYFISKQKFEQDILSGKFVEHGEYEKNIYGTSLDAIRHVVNSGKSCVLNLHPQALKILKHSDLKPYVIFVRPPSLDRLRLMKAQTGENLKDEELREMIEKGREMEDTHGHYFDYVLINSDQERAYNELINEINRIQVEPTWVPLSWLS
ncbi:protein PALS1-like isoform X1 [Ptychodera flava]|uniref:protein PALS1-like isoform X1 n=1 Tax=Ptychodera flava TaxID=63121 RepID=UPI00396A5858